MKLVVVIPAYNEEKTIGTVIEAVPRNMRRINNIDILVVDDGSTDKTVEVSKRNGASVVSHGINEGVGVAFQTGIKNALDMGADIIVNIDADGQFNPNDIEKLIEPIIFNRADVVTASRFKDKNLMPKMPWHKKLGNKFFSWLISSLINEKFYDVSCGFRAYSRETALNLNLFGKFTYTQESFLDLGSKGMRIVEVPLKIKGVREYGKSKVANNVIRYGFKALWIIMKTVRDYKPLMFFGTFGVLSFVIGLFFTIFVFIHWLNTNHTTPYTQMITVGAVFLILGFLLIILALIADMMTRIKNNQERILYELKRDR